MNDTEESAPAGKITQSLIILHCNMALQARVRFVSVAMAGKSVASLAIASVSVYAASVYRNSFQSILLLVKFHLLFFFLFSVSLWLRILTIMLVNPAFDAPYRHLSDIYGKSVHYIQVHCLIFSIGLFNITSNYYYCYC